MPGVVASPAPSGGVNRRQRAQASDLAKNVYLEALHDRNEVRYCRLLTDRVRPHIVRCPEFQQAARVLGRRLLAAGERSPA